MLRGQTSTTMRQVVQVQTSRKGTSLRQRFMNFPGGLYIFVKIGRDLPSLNFPTVSWIRSRARIRASRRRVPYGTHARTATSKRCAPTGAKESRHGVLQQQRQQQQQQQQQQHPIHVSAQCAGPRVICFQARDASHSININVIKSQIKMFQVEFALKKTPTTQEMTSTTELTTSTPMWSIAGHSVSQTTQEPLTSHGSAHLDQIGLQKLQKSHAGAKHQIKEGIM